MFPPDIAISTSSIMPSSEGALLDTNVLVPGSLRYTLLYTAAECLYRPFLSEDILAELYGTLIRIGMDNAQALQVLTLFRQRFPEALVTDYHDLIPLLTNQQNDRHILAAAVKAHAQFIVTNNLRDFPPASLAPFEIEALFPNDFLNYLYDSNREGIINALIKQASDLRRSPRPLAKVLDALEKHAPLFVSRVRPLCGLERDYKSKGQSSS